MIMGVIPACRLTAVPCPTVLRRFHPALVGQRYRYSRRLKRLTVYTMVGLLARIARLVSCQLALKMPGDRDLSGSQGMPVVLLSFYVTDVPQTGSPR